MSCEAHLEKILFSDVTLTRENDCEVCLIGLHLRSGEFLFGAKYRLGLPVFREEGECPAWHCKVMSNVYGDHAISCSIGGKRIARHSHLRDVLSRSPSRRSSVPRRRRTACSLARTSVQRTSLF